MEYKVNTSFNVGDKLYSLCSNGDINTYYISKIKITGEITGEINDEYIKTTAIYHVADPSNFVIATINETELRKRFFTDKKEIVKYITDQL